MKYSLYMALVFGCNSKPVGTQSTATDSGDLPVSDTGASDPIVLDGEAYTLTLTPILPIDQSNLFSQIDGLDLRVTQGDGTQSTHRLWSAEDATDGTASDVPFLTEAVLELAGYSGSTLVFYGQSAPLSVTEGVVDARITVAKTETMAQLTSLGSGLSFAPMVSDGHGRFYIFGGANEGMREQAPTTDVMRIDLSTPNDELAFVQLEQSLPDLTVDAAARMGHTATRLEDTSLVLVAGGIHRYMTLNDSAYQWHFDEPTASNAFLFDTETETFQALGDLQQARSGHVAVENDNGEILLVGGFLQTTGSFSFSEPRFEVFDPSNLTFEEGEILTTGTALHAAANVPGEGVLVCGGADYSYNFVSECSLINLAHVTVEIPGPGMALVAPAMTTLADGRVLLTGGLNGTDNTFSSSLFTNTLSAVANAFIFEDDTWRAVGGMSHPRAWHASILMPDGRVLLSGGVTGVTGQVSVGPTTSEGDGVMFHSSDAMACAEIFDPTTETFTEVDICTPETEASSLPARVMFQQAAIDPVQGVLLAGGIGTNGNGAQPVSLFRFEPSF